MNYEDKYYDLLKESNRVYSENIEFRKIVIDLQKCKQCACRKL